MRPIPPCDNCGSATIMMVFMVAVILTVGLGFNWLVKEHLQASESLKNKAEAIVMARSAYDTLIYILLNGKVMPQEVVLSGVDALTSLPRIPLDNSSVPLTENVNVRIQDSNGMFSLATLNTEAAKRMIQRLLPMENSSIPVNSLLDWTDEDDLTRVNGAEVSFYRKEGSSYLPRNYALQYPEEFGFVRGMSPEGYERLRSSLTLLPATGFNPNTATDDVMLSCLDISEDTLKRIKAYKAETGIITDSALQVLTGRKITTAASPSLYMDVTVNAGQPKSMYSIHAGLSLKQNNFAPYSVLYWREE